VTLSRRTAAALVTGAICLGAAGCGDADTGDPIPSDKATTMQGQLDAVQAAVDSGRCEAVSAAVSRLQATIATLGGDGVGDDVQNALGDGADNLRSLASDSCQPEEPQTDTTETTESVPAPEPAPVPSVPEPEPEPAPTTPDEETPPDDEEPVEPTPDEGGGQGQFDPGGEDGAAGPPGQLKKQGND
jgi:hypothetical protein